MIPPPASGPYANILSGFLGFLTKTQQEDYWNGFLALNNLQSNPSNTDPETLELFTNYASKVAATIAFVGKTQIVFSVFEILSLLMNTMTSTQISTQQNLLYWTEKQEAYTTMATKVPVYTSFAPSTLFTSLPSGISPNANPAQYQLGYANLTMQDVLNSMQATAQKGQSVVFSMAATNGYVNDGLNSVYPDPTSNWITMTATPVAGSNPPTYTFSAQAFYQTVAHAAGGYYGINNNSVPVVTSAPISTTADTATQITAMNSVFWQAFQSYSGFQTYPPGIPWSASVYTGFVGVNFSLTPPANVPVTPVPSIPNQDAGQLTNTDIVNTTDIRFAQNPDIPYHDIQLLGVQTSVFPNTITAALQANSASDAQRRAAENASLSTDLNAIQTKKDILQNLEDSESRTVDSSSQGRLQLSNVFQATVQSLSNILNTLYQ